MLGVFQQYGLQVLAGNELVGHGVADGAEDRDQRSLSKSGAVTEV